MQDIFGRVDQVFGGGLSADSMFMTFAGLSDGGGVGLLVQNISLQYSQPVRRIFELGPGNGQGSQYTYYIVGRPEGTLQIARIFGFAAVSIAFYQQYGNPCNQTPDLTLTASAGCNGQENGSNAMWFLKGCVITGIAMNASAQEMLIQESVAMMFISFDLDEIPAAGF